MSKNAVKKWKKENMASLRCTMPVEKAELFKAWCCEHNTAQNAVFLKFVNIAVDKDLCDQDKVDLEMLYMNN